MKINQWPAKNSSNILSNPNGGFVTLEAQKTRIMTVKNCQNYATIRDVKVLQDNPYNLEIIQ